MKMKTKWLAMLYQRIAQACRAKRSFAIHSITLFLLVTAGAVRALAQQPDGGMPGPYPVGHTSFVAKADDRGRLVAVDVYYPADVTKITAQSPQALYAAFPYNNTTPYMTSAQWEALGYDRAYEAGIPAKGPFALVMFGTGLGTPGWGYLYFGTRLASHGFIVSVIHSYRDVTWPPNYNGDWPSQKLFYRPRDMSSALTEMLRRDEKKGDLLQGLIDRRYLVAAGHSAGGYAAMVEFSGDDQVCDTIEIYNRGEKNPPASICQPTPPDRRFTALMSLEGGHHLLHWNEFTRIRVPTLIQGQANWADGNLSVLAPGDESYNSRPHAAICTQARALRVDYRMIDHQSFMNTSDGLLICRAIGVFSDAELAELMPWYLPGSYGMTVGPIREGHRMITKYAVAWLRAEVLQDGDPFSKHILTQAYVKAKEPNVEIYWNEDCVPPGTLPNGWFSYFTEMTPGACATAEKDPPAYFVPSP